TTLFRSGPAGLMAAETLATGGAAVTIYERMPSPARKFLMAGRGGLNLTHGEPFAAFVTRYGNAVESLRPAIEALPPGAVRDWSEGLGQPTFVGSSGRVFPRAMKASPLLRAWLRRLSEAGVEFRFRHRWTGWDAQRRLVFEAPDGTLSVQADAALLALGGASWPRLGSDASWTAILLAQGIGVAPLAPANCGFTVDWSAHFRDRFEGTPLKRIALTFGPASARGEAVVTRRGIEGGAIYALSGPLREALAAGDNAIVSIDLRPDLSEAALAKTLSAPHGKRSFSTFLRKAAGLPPVAIALLREGLAADPLSAWPADRIAGRIKAMPLPLIAPAPIARAISSAGGVRFAETDGDYMLRRLPGIFVAGEMLDWEAPTGGYLLQACFATGAAAGRAALAWLDAKRVS
ncbi:MAG: TIGR03862 family flavoprotein, partial [Pseudorhodoplanes sp.]